jgi:hypothetical protein
VGFVLCRQRPTLPHTFACSTIGGDFQVVGAINGVRVIAKGSAVRDRKRLWKIHGRGAWRKLKGIAGIKFKDGALVKAELHWYEAHGIGKKEFKIKRILAEEE